MIPCPIWFHSPRFHGIPAWNLHFPTLHFPTVGWGRKGDASKANLGKVNEDCHRSKSKPQVFIGAKLPEELNFLEPRGESSGFSTNKESPIFLDLLWNYPFDACQNPFLVGNPALNRHLWLKFLSGGGKTTEDLLNKMLGKSWSYKIVIYHGIESVKNH